MGLQHGSVWSLWCKHKQWDRVIMACTWLHPITHVWIFPVFLWFFCSHNGHPCRNSPKWKLITKKVYFHLWTLLHAKPTPANTRLRSQNCHQFFQTGVFCNIYSPFSLFFTLGSHAQWKRVERWRRDAATERGIPCSVAASLRHWSGDSDSAKKAVKKRIIFSAGQDWHLLVPEKLQKIGGKLWQLDSIMGHQIYDLEPFMRLLVCECGYHWRLRVNTCAKVDGAQHPQGK